MRSLAPFLPPHLGERSGHLSRPPRRFRLDAAMLLADVSGFTALTERLEAQGRLGAEIVADVIGRAFAPGIRAIARQGGSIVSFGGDALFAIFPGASPVRRALGAAAAVRDAVSGSRDPRGRPEAAALTVSQAVHYGPVQELHLGLPERRHLLVTSPAVASLARLQERAVRGEILVSSAARAHGARERAPEPVELARLHADTRLLATYVDPRLRTALRSFEGCYRRCCILFLETRGHRAPALQAWFLALTEVLSRYDGILLKTDLSTHGTKWIAVFGIPAAHEDDPARAAGAALDLFARLPPGLAARGGLNAGVVANVLIGTGARRSFEVMGDAVNTAARAMGRARWGEVLVPDATRRGLGSIGTKPRGKHAMKGKAEPLRLHALHAPSRGIRSPRATTPMVGRDAELERLRAALGHALAGRAGVIGIRGEAGIGKSRLKHAAAVHAREMGFLVHEGAAIDLGGMPYVAIGDLARHALGIAEHARPRAVLARVAAAARRLALADVDRRHLAEVLGARVPGHPRGHLGPEDARLNDMLAIRSLFEALAREQPRLLVLEDLHWADGASREAAGWLAKARGRLLLLLLSRPGFTPPEGAEEISLCELPPEAVRELLRSHLGDVPPAVEALVRDRASGNPFYVEEIASHLLDTGAVELAGSRSRLVHELGPDDLPAGVEAVIAARLDRLSASTRRAAQHAAVIGRSFRFDLWATLLGSRGAADRAEQELCRREICAEHAADPRELSFRHALMRDVAYAGILASRRRTMHRAVADAIETRLPAPRDTLLPVLGHHRERAGQLDPARSCYAAAARASVARYAHEEAVALFRRYLDIVDRETEESVRIRIDLGTDLRVAGLPKDARREIQRALEAARGVGSRTLEAEAMAALASLSHDEGRVIEARALFERALASHREEGNRDREGVVLGNLAVLHQEQGRMDEARESFERALAVRRQLGDRVAEGMLISNLGILHAKQGRMDLALANFEQALRIERDVKDLQNQGMVLSNLGMVHGRMGRLDEARGFLEQALAIHRQTGCRRSEGIALANLGVLHRTQARLQEARLAFESALAIQRDIGDRRTEGIALGSLGLLNHEEGRMDEATAAFAQGLAIHRQLGDRRNEGIALGGLALHVAMTDPERAEALAREGEAILRQAGDLDSLGTVIATRGHLALARGETAAPALAEIASISATLPVRPGSQLGLALARLESAQKAFLHTETLVCGYRVDDLPAGVLRYLRVHRPQAVPPEIRARIDAGQRPKLGVSS